MSKPLPPFRGEPFEKRVERVRNPDKNPDLDINEAKLFTQKKLCDDIKATQVIIRCSECDEILIDNFYFDWIPGTEAGYKDQIPLCIDHCLHPKKAKAMPIYHSAVVKTQISIAKMLHKVEKPKDDTGPVFHMKLKPDENFGMAHRR